MDLHSGYILNTTSQRKNPSSGRLYPFGACFSAVNNKRCVHVGEVGEA